MSGEQRDPRGRLGHPPSEVLIVIENMSFTYDTRMRNIAGTLRAAEYGVRVICPRFPGDPARSVGPADVHVRHFRQPQFPGAFGHVIEYAASIAAILLHALRERAVGRADIVHLCNPPDALVVIGAVCRLLGARVVYDQHDLNPELFALRYPGAPRGARRLVAFAERLAVRVANEIVVTNETARTRTLGRSATHGERVTVIRNGTPLAHAASLHSETRTEDGVLIGYLGHTNSQDGLDVLLATAQELIVGRSRGDLRFLVVGDGDALRALEAGLVQHRLDAAFELAGRLPPHEALRRIASCDICIQPDPRNDFTEATTMVKTLEYLALGRAVAAFDLRETRWSCGEAALYAADDSPAALADVIETLADDPELRGRLGAQARDRFTRILSWECSVAPLLAVYDRLARSASGERSRVSRRARKAHIPLGLAGRAAPLTSAASAQDRRA